jgi:hypothetical protein
LVNSLRHEFSPLAGSLETQIRAESITDKKLELMFVKGLRSQDELHKKLSEALFKTTAKRWHISFDSENTNETLAETLTREASERKEKALKSSEIRKILDAFPGSEVVKVNTN